MAGWHHWLDRRESEWTPGVGDGQGGLACCDSWGGKESDTTEQLNWLTYPSVLKDGWEQREKPSFLLVFIRALIPFMKAPPSWPHLILIISQRPQLLILSHCRGRVPGHKYWYSQVFIKRFVSPLFSKQHVLFSYSIFLF